MSFTGLEVANTSQRVGLLVDNGDSERPREETSPAETVIAVSWAECCISRKSTAIILGLSSFCYSFHFLATEPNPISYTYGWHFQYLTNIGLGLAWLTFATAVLSDMTKSRRLFVIKNALGVASAPLECLISLLYWNIRFVDKKLLENPHAPPLPWQMDLSVHLVPVVVLVIDLLFFSPPYAMAFLPAFGLSGFIACAYWVWAEECFRHNNFYAYPLFAELDVYQRALLFSGSALVMTMANITFVQLYHAVNGREKEVKEKRSVRFTRSGRAFGE